MIFIIDCISLIMCCKLKKIGGEVGEEELFTNEKSEEKVHRCPQEKQVKTAMNLIMPHTCQP